MAKAIWEKQYMQLSYLAYPETLDLEILGRHSLRRYFGRNALWQAEEVLLL